MGILSVARALYEAYLKVLMGEHRQATLDMSQQEALKKILNSIGGNSDVSLTAIQGPPGTGKTSMYVVALSDSLDKGYVSNDVKALYIAPTNQLVIETLTRYFEMMFSKGYEPRDLLPTVRVYGSKISPLSYGDREIVRRLNVEESELKKVCKYIDDDTLVIFTTEWQRVSGRVTGHFNAHMLVDEASRSPFFRPFVTVADNIARRFSQGEEVELAPSLSVVGDPQQAVALESEYQLTGKGLLIMNKVINILERLGLKERNYSFLRYTKRIPAPSERPISIAFYDGELRSSVDARTRLRELSSVKVDERLVNKLPNRRLAQMLHNVLEMALGSACPLILIRTTPFPRRETYHSERVMVASYVALLLSKMLADNKLFYSLAVIAPYSDLVLSSKLYFNRLLEIAGIDRREMMTTPTFTTVQSMLGNEADIVISILGKEWVGSDLEDLYLTIYYREPELLNVQLSRHRRLQVVIGDPIRLRSASAGLRRRIGMERALPLSSIEIARLQVLSEGAGRLKALADALLEMVGYERGTKRIWESPTGIMLDITTN